MVLSFKFYTRKRRENSSVGLVLVWFVPAHPEFVGFIELELIGA
jgi:hypothetical protein